MFHKCKIKGKAAELTAQYTLSWPKYSDHINMYIIFDCVTYLFNLNLFSDLRNPLSKEIKDMEGD